MIQAARAYLLSCFCVLLTSCGVPDDAAATLEGPHRSAAIETARAEPRFAAIRDRFDDLDSLIAETEDEATRLLARRAREEVETKVLTETRGEGHFVLPGVHVNPVTARESFTISETPPPSVLETARQAASRRAMRFSTGEDSQYALTFLTQDGGSTIHVQRDLTPVPPTLAPCYSRTTGPIVVLHTELEDDAIPFPFQPRSGDDPMLGNNARTYLLATGSVGLRGLLDVHCSAGMTLRFRGHIGFIPELSIQGDESDPLTFFMIENVGAVYLAGAGRVLNADGDVLFEAGGT